MLQSRRLEFLYLHADPNLSISSLQSKTRKYIAGSIDLASLSFFNVRITHYGVVYSNDSASTSTITLVRGIFWLSAKASIFLSVALSFSRPDAFRMK